MIRNSCRYRIEKSLIIDLQSNIMGDFKDMIQKCSQLCKFEMSSLIKMMFATLFFLLRAKVARFFMENWINVHSISRLFVQKEFAIGMLNVFLKYAMSKFSQKYMRQTFYRIRLSLIN